MKIDTERLNRIKELPDYQSQVISYGEYLRELSNQFEEERTSFSGSFMHIDMSTNTYCPDLNDTGDPYGLLYDYGHFYLIGQPIVIPRKDLWGRIFARGEEFLEVIIQINKDLVGRGSIIGFGSQLLAYDKEFRVFFERTVARMNEHSGEEYNINYSTKQRLFKPNSTTNKRLRKANRAKRKMIDDWYKKHPKAFRQI